MICFRTASTRRLRKDLRTLRQFQVRLEIQRRAVAIAVRRVDKTPGRPERAAAGRRAGPAGGRNSVRRRPSTCSTAISDLRNAQNNFLSVWLNFYQQRVRARSRPGIHGSRRARAVGSTIRSNESDWLRGRSSDPLPPPVPDSGSASGHRAGRRRTAVDALLPPASPFACPTERIRRRAQDRVSPSPGDVERAAARGPPDAAATDQEPQPIVLRLDPAKTNLPAAEAGQISEQRQRRRRPPPKPRKQAVLRRN